MEVVRVIISASLPSMHELKMVHLPNVPFKFKLGYQYLRSLYCEVPRLCMIYEVACTCQSVMLLDAFCNVMLHVPLVIHLVLSNTSVTNSQDISFVCSIGICTYWQQPYNLISTPVLSFISFSLQNWILFKTFSGQCAIYIYIYIYCLLLYIHIHSPF